MEKHYVYLKDNRVVQIAVFAEQNEELADSIAHELGFDDALWIGDAPVPHMYSSYDGTTFTNPTPQYLYSIGVLSVDPDAPVVEQPTN